MSLNLDPDSADLMTKMMCQMVLGPSYGAKWHYGDKRDTYTRPMSMRRSWECREDTAVLWAVAYMTECMFSLRVSHCKIPSSGASVSGVLLYENGAIMSCNGKLLSRTAVFSWQYCASMRASRSVGCMLLFVMTCRNQDDFCLTWFLKPGLSTVGMQQRNYSSPRWAQGLTRSPIHKWLHHGQTASFSVWDEHVPWQSSVVLDGVNGSMNHKWQMRVKLAPAAVRFCHIWFLEKFFKEEWPKWNGMHSFCHNSNLDPYMMYASHCQGGNAYRWLKIRSKDIYVDCCRLILWMKKDKDGSLLISESNNTGHKPIISSNLHNYFIPHEEGRFCLWSSNAKDANPIPGSSLT